MTTPTTNPKLDEIDRAAREAANYLYVIEDSRVNGQISPELYKAISALRQLINEEFVGKDKTVSSQLIYDTLKPYFQAACVGVES